MTTTIFARILHWYNVVLIYYFVNQYVQVLNKLYNFSQMEYCLKSFSKVADIYTAHDSS